MTKPFVDTSMSFHRKRVNVHHSPKWYSGWLSNKTMGFQKSGFIFCVLVTLLVFYKSEAQETEPRAFLKCPTSRAATFMYFTDIWTSVTESNTIYDSLNCGNVKVITRASVTVHLCTKCLESNFIKLMHIY
jgi:hypothetical protein